MDSFVQHDVQELNRMLTDNLEEKMKVERSPSRPCESLLGNSFHWPQGTPVEGSINKLLEGKMCNYIKCLNVNAQSSREEKFFGASFLPHGDERDVLNMCCSDLSLNVKGMKNVYDALDKYCAEEIMDGDNQYRTEEFGLQDAARGVSFTKFPPVLELHLLRFEFDYQKMQNYKVVLFMCGLLLGAIASDLALHTGERPI